VGKRRRRQFHHAEKAAADIRALARPRIRYKIRDTVAETFERPSIDAIDLATGRASVWGRLFGKAGTTGFRLNSRRSRRRICVSRSRPKTTPTSIAFVCVRLRRRAKHFSVSARTHLFNQKGQSPADPGAGARRRPRSANLDATDRHLCRWRRAQPLRDRSPGAAFHLQPPALAVPREHPYSVFDMRSATHFQIKVWSGTMTGRIFTARRRSI